MPLISYFPTFSSIPINKGNFNSKIFSKWTISSPDEIKESNRFGSEGIDLCPKDMSKHVLPFGPFFGTKWLLPIQGHYIKPGPTSCIAILMKLVSRLNIKKKRSKIGPKL